MLSVQAAEAASLTSALQAYWSQHSTDVVMATSFLVLGALVSWGISRFYYLKSSKNSLAILGAKPWRLLSRVDEGIRARLTILVDGEPANDLTRMRYRVCNVGRTSIAPQTPLSLLVPHGATLVEAAIPSVGPEGLAVHLSVSESPDGLLVNVDAPLLDAGQQFSLTLLVKNLSEDFEPVFSIRAPGVPLRLSPAKSLPGESRTEVLTLFGPLAIGLVALILARPLVMPLSEDLRMLVAVFGVAVIWVGSFLLKRAFTKLTSGHIHPLVPVQDIVVSGLPRAAASTSDSTSNNGPEHLRATNTDGSVMPEESPGNTFRVGDAVKHEVFGLGTVSQVAGDLLTITFADGTVRRMLFGYARMVRVAPTE